MKKLLVMISAFMLTSVSTSQLVENMISTNILKPLIKQENKEVEEFKQFKEEKTIDFNKVEDYFKDEKNKTNNQYNGFNLSYNSTFKNKNQIDTAFTKSLEYTKEFKEKNMSLNEIIIKFKNEIPRFKTVYDRAERDFFKNNQTAIKNINNKNLLKNSIKNIKNSDEDKMKIEALEFWNKLNDFKVGFITTASISAILAAGLWAASAFDFGISIPWAVAATITAVTCTAVAEAINIYTTTNDPLIDKVNQNIEVGISITGLCYAFFRDLYAIIQFSLVTIGTTSVITATGAAIFAVGVAIFTWITSTNIFTQVENSKNEEIKQWVEDAKNGRLKNYNFEFKRVGHSTNGSTNDIETYSVKKWTDYASSIEEFKQTFKYYGFADALAQAGGGGTTVTRENFLIPTEKFNELKYANDVSSYFKICSYNYDILATTQTCTIACLNLIEGEYLKNVFIFQTSSYLCANDAWVSLRFNDIFITI